MNAGGVPNTCKSNGDCYFGSIPSGERVSNALVTYPKERDNSAKELLIPHVCFQVRGWGQKGAIRFGRGLRPIS